jgi:hypothetical protein
VNLTVSGAARYRWKTVGAKPFDLLAKCRMSPA